MIRIDVSRLSVLDFNKLSQHLKGAWHVEAVADKIDRNKDKVYLVLGEGVVIEENEEVKVI